MKYCKKLPSERLAAETARNPKTPDPAKAYINTTPSLLKWKSIICTPLPTRKDELTIWVPTSPASIRNGVLPFVKTSRWSEGFHQIRSLVAPGTWGRGDGTWAELHTFSAKLSRLSFSAKVNRPSSCSAVFLKCRAWCQETVESSTVSTLTPAFSAAESSRRSQSTGNTGRWSDVTWSWRGTPGSCQACQVPWSMSQVLHQHLRTSVKMLQFPCPCFVISA